MLSSRSWKGQIRWAYSCWPQFPANKARGAARHRESVNRIPVSPALNEAPQQTRILTLIVFQICVLNGHEVAG
jgi:hypothetical protein